MTHRPSTTSLRRDAEAGYNSCLATELAVGLQMVTGMNRETDLLRAAAAFEAERPWAHIVPDLRIEP
jgi:hypothetical protein